MEIHEPMEQVEKGEEQKKDEGDCRRKKINLKIEN